ncbi:MAG: glutamate synthase large subunit [Spirochaetaceae bacterium]|jgi:glutamate synthase (NADPH/NADH) large chain|nr:glutamate synthase large subunit [Spirochaetaceae bacterium]
MQRSGSTLRLDTVSQGRGLYKQEYEHDSCGIGFVADIKGRKTHDILERALTVLERMSHRGAESADNNTGDGSGVLLQMPHSYYQTVIPNLGKEGSYGAGLLFLPNDAEAQKALLSKVREIAGQSALSVLAVRDVPVNNSSIGYIAREAQPVVKQVFFTGDKDAPPSCDELNLQLYFFRKRFEKALKTDKTLKNTTACFPSVSSSVIVYKGMLTPVQLREFYPELNDSGMKTAVALVHSRFSTNTFPAWDLAQPFRFIAHNGEINTIKGNRFWARAREAIYESRRFGEKLKDILPLIEEGKSDSASFDNMLELLVFAGKTLPQALMMMIPEAWNEKNPISDELKAFYEYNACSMEPWDGPASIVFCDGRYVGGTLDRNGLRPSRYTITKDGLIVMASETGVQDFKPEEIEYKGRLLPGKLLLVDLKEGHIIPDEEVKKQVSTAKPYLRWVKENIITLEQENKDQEPHLDERNILFLERQAGYTREDRERLFIPMIESAQEPSGSMGTDTPLAVFSDLPQRPYAYFKQLFAQVTNPPIDSIREDLVMTLTSFVGPQLNLLEESPLHCRRIKVKKPILTEDDLSRLEKIAEKDFKIRRLEAIFPFENAPHTLKTALERLISDALRAAQDGVSLLILSDKAAANPESGYCAIPALLAVGAVHHALIRSGSRMKLSIIAESFEPREIMHFALLFGYGADLIAPYGALASIAALRKSFDGRTGAYAHAEHQYLKGLQKAMLKVMAKMGTSTLRSYRASQIFEAVGLGKEIIDLCFTGTDSPIGGIGFAEIEEETLERYRLALKWDAEYENSPDKNTGAGALRPSTLMYGDGQYRWRKGGEVHAWNPEAIYLLQWATRTADYAKFKQFSEICNTLNRRPHVIRGLFDFVQPEGSSGAVPLEEVESVEEIMRRFTTGAMSFGSISKEAHETIAAALNSIHGRSNSGEGGEDPERFIPKADGSSTRSAIKQVASARFGVTSDYLAHCIEIQIKMAQGAKPGEGGQLPGHKVDVMIAKVRHATPGVTLISPPPHHDIYSIEDLAELIFDLKNANPQARISVKLVSEAGVGTVAAGVVKAHADNLLISGYDGGTGASPQSSIRHAGLPWELGLSETHQTLVKNGLRGRVRLQTDGQLKTGRDIVIAALLGAEEFGFGTAALIVMGCVMMRKCHENTCPMGVATQDPRLRARFQGKSEYLVNFFRFLAEETREIMASLGFRRFDELIGRTDCLVQRKTDKAKASKIDLSAILYAVQGPDFISGGKETHCVQDQIHKINRVLDRELIDKCKKALEEKQPVSLELPLSNTDRAVGAMLSYEVSKRYGERGLPENCITVDWRGSAGQSFGAFLAPGISFRLSGDANDYLGKGLSGGIIAVSPPSGSTFKSNENIIAGNTILYGATSGETYIAGVVGERFCVRNSGATAVVEGAGDHCAEYMTGGRLIVLGNVGRNFAAGMSGGVAYVLDHRGNFEFYLNKGMVELSGLEDSEDEHIVKESIRKHLYWTGSVYASSILNNWADEKPRFIKILPVEYKRALEQMKLAELDKKLFQIREHEEIGEKG